MVSDSYSKESLRKTGENQKTTKIGYSESSKPFVTTEKNSTFTHRYFHCHAH